MLVVRLAGVSGGREGVVGEAAGGRAAIGRTDWEVVCMHVCSVTRVQPDAQDHKFL